MEKNLNEAMLLSRYLYKQNLKMLISKILQNYKILHLFRFLRVWDMEQKSSSADTGSS